MSNKPGTSLRNATLAFYCYAAISLLAATILLFISGEAFLDHYFHPQILAITHIMALGWGTMVILGTSHHIVQYLAGNLYSSNLAIASFLLAAMGIPLLAYGFFVFNMGDPAKWGGRLILLANICYLINVGKSISRGKEENIHSIYIFSAGMWLFITIFMGLALVYNFTYPLFRHNSVHYLPLHVHAGSIGWFLLMVIGVSSKLIPVFLRSSYRNEKMLWWIFSLVNGGLVLYILLFYFTKTHTVHLIPGSIQLLAILLFIYYCYQCFNARQREADEQIKMSLLSIALILVPVLLLIVLIILSSYGNGPGDQLATTYGFLIIFGWITAIILGMTFKTLPIFLSGTLLTVDLKPQPVNRQLFRALVISYLSGFLIFALGIQFSQLILLKAGAVLLIFMALAYNFLLFRQTRHKDHGHH